MNLTRYCLPMLALCLLPAALAGADSEKRDGAKHKAKVSVCHVPPGNPGAARTLLLPDPAVRAHLRHGDTQGSCEAVEGRVESPDELEAREAEAGPMPAEPEVDDGKKNPKPKRKPPADGSRH